MTRAERRRVIVTPLLVWGALMLLLAMTAGYAVIPGAPFKTAVGVTIAAVKALLIAVLFMQLRSAAGLVRLAAVAGLSWGSLLFILTFADLLTR